MGADAAPVDSRKISAERMDDNLQDHKYWIFSFSEIWEAIAKCPYPLQLPFCHI